MEKIRLLSKLLLFSGLFLVACEKVEQPIALPPSEGSEYARIEMGEDYTDQVFFDLETKSVVYTSPIKSWDFAFEASANGYHVFMNGGGTNVFVYNTHETDITKVLTPPSVKDSEWQFDASCAVNDSTGIGDWLVGGNSKKEVYIVKLDPQFYPDTFKKIQILSVNDNEYVMLFGDLRSAKTQMINIAKNSNYNYSYFSFSEGGRIVNPEPPKNTWDIVFTRYRIVYHHLDKFPYPVTGVLSNPYNTAITEDTVTGYPNIKSGNLLAYKFSEHRDIIGYDWKILKLNRSTGESSYAIDKNKVYIIKNRRDQFYKLHFLDFYYQSVKGNPSFEYERIQ